LCPVALTSIAFYAILLFRPWLPKAGMQGHYNIYIVDYSLQEPHLIRNLLECSAPVALTVNVIGQRDKISELFHSCVQASRYKGDKSEE